MSEQIIGTEVDVAGYEYTVWSLAPAKGTYYAFRLTLSGGHVWATIKRKSNREWGVVGRPLPQFDNPPTDPRTLVRVNDPVTSHAAANSIDIDGLEKMVYDEICRTEDRGATQDELLSAFPYMSYSSVTARPAALKRKGLVAYNGESRPGRSGRSQKVLVAAKFLASETDDRRPATHGSTNGPDT